jgi:hypothetical protein
MQKCQFEIGRHFTFMRYFFIEAKAAEKRVVDVMSCPDVDVSIRDNRGFRDGSGDTAETVARRNGKHGLADALQLYAKQQGRWQHLRSGWIDFVLQLMEHSNLCFVKLVPNTVKKSSFIYWTHTFQTKSLSGHNGRQCRSCLPRDRQSRRRHSVKHAARRARCKHD